jgi:hypothetical protein
MMNDQLPTIAEYARQSPIPKKVLLLLGRENIIQDPLSQEDQIGLHLLEKVWGNKDVLRPQLNRMSMRARISFVRTATLNSKWERYAYTRFRNQAPGKKLAMQTVLEEIETTFCFRLNSQLRKRLYLIRNRAQVARHREKKLRPN